MCHVGFKSLRATGHSGCCWSFLGRHQPSSPPRCVRAPPAQAASKPPWSFVPLPSMALLATIYSLRCPSRLPTRPSVAPSPPRHLSLGLRNGHSSGVCPPPALHFHHPLVMPFQGFLTSAPNSWPNSALPGGGGAWRDGGRGSATLPCFPAVLLALPDDWPGQSRSSHLLEL